MSLFSRLVPSLLGGFLNGVALISPRRAGQLAFDDVFSRPRRRLPRPPDTAWLTTARQHTVTVNTRAVCIYEWPAPGPVILLAHGWESQAGRWRRLGEYLSEKGYHVVALDAPGHGRSEGNRMTIPDYAAALQAGADRFKPAILITHSVGAASSMYFLTHYPNTIQRVVTLGAPARLEFVLRGFAGQLGLSQRTWRGLTGYFSQRFGKPVTYFSGESWADQLPQKALLIHDTHDNVIPYAEGERLAHDWKAATFVPTEGLGHGLNKPEVFDIIATWLTADSPQPA